MGYSLLIFEVNYILLEVLNGIDKGLFNIFIGEKYL